MRVSALFLIVLVVVGGCASGGSPIDEKQVAQITKGKTTRADLVRMFGDPMSQTSGADGRQHLSWAHVHYNAVFALVPFVGGGADMKSEGLHVTLGPDGTVEDYTTSTTQSPKTTPW